MLRSHVQGSAVCPSQDANGKCFLNCQERKWLLNCAVLPTNVVVKPLSLLLISLCDIYFVFPLFVDRIMFSTIIPEQQL